MLPKGWTPGTGTYDIGELAIEKGELVTNGGFDTDTDWTKGTGWNISDGKANCDGSQETTVGIYQSANIFSGRVYVIKYTVSNYSNGIVYSNIGGIASGENGENRESNGTYNETLYLTGGNTNVQLIGNVDFIGSVDNFSVVEIPPLPKFFTGTKYLENTVAGTLAIPSKQAYGTWEFDCLQGSSGNIVLIEFISDINGDVGDYNGYLVRLSNTGSISILIKTAGLCSSQGSYILANTWYRIKITRSLSGEFTIYIKGGSFGNNWVLVDTTDGSGTNPVINNTYIISNFCVLDLDVGDRVANFKFTKGIKQ